MIAGVLRSGKAWCAAALMTISVLAVALPATAGSGQSRGKAVYDGGCIACHGGDGAGTLPGVPDLSDKTGPLAQDDAVLLPRMVEGFQSPGSPLAMPPRGGVPELTDADLKAALEYMRRELQQPQ